MDHKAKYLTMLPMIMAITDLLSGLIELAFQVIMKFASQVKSSQSEEIKLFSQGRELLRVVFVVFGRAINLGE